MGKGINMNEKGGYATPLDGSRDTLDEQDIATEKGKTEDGNGEVKSCECPDVQEKSVIRVVTPRNGPDPATLWWSFP